MRATPEERAYAWARYRRLMRWMVLVAAAVVVAVLAWLKISGAPMPIHMVIATIAGVGLTMLLGTGLMGLAFFSAGSGHDDLVGEIDEDDADEGPRR